MNIEDVFKQLKKEEFKMMNHKKKKWMIALLAIFIFTQTMSGIGGKAEAFSPGDYLTIHSGGSYSCMYWGITFSAIEHFTYLGEDAYYPAYRLSFDGNPFYRDRSTILQGEVQEEELRRIVQAGYPYHSYSDLGCTDAYPAYMATQLLILEYTQGEDLSLYRPCDERGREVEIAIQNIRKNREIQEDLPERPQINFVAETDWEIYEYDPNYYVKSMYFECDQPNFNQMITITDELGNGTRVLDETNFDRQTFLPYERWKILIPVGEEEKEVSLLAEVTTQTYPMFLARSTENGEEFLLTQNPMETIQERYYEKANSIEENPQIPTNGEKDEENEQNKGEDPDENQEPDGSNEKEDTEKEEQNGNVNEMTNQNQNENINKNENQSENRNNNENTNQNINENQSEANSTSQSISQNQNENLIKNENKQEVQVIQQEEIQVNPIIQIIWKNEMTSSQNQQEEILQKTEETEKEKIEQERKMTEGTTEEKEVEKENPKEALKSVSSGIKMEENRKQYKVENSSSIVLPKVSSTAKTTQKKLPRTGY